MLNTSPTAIGVVVCWRISAEAFLQLRRHRILHPPQAVRLEALADARRLDRRQPVMDVVQQVQLRAELGAHPLEQPSG